MPPVPAQRSQTPPSKFLIFQDWSGGMNTQSARAGLKENEAAVLENLQPIAANKLKGVPAPAAAFATLTGASVTVVRQFQVNLGTNTSLMLSFTVQGAGFSTNLGTGVTTQFATAGTFSSTGPDVTTWLGVRALIADAVAGYCTYDGTLFVQQGGVSPNTQVTAGGSGYANGATATFTGGSGTGATFSVTVVAGVVTALVLTAPGTGFLSTDVLTVTIHAVSGGTGATANAHVWPTVSPAPSTLAVAFARVWLAQSRTLIVTGTGSSTFGQGFDDFASGDASVTTTIGDADLVNAITALRFLEGFLYIFGDASVKAIASITVSGGTTSFTITPLSSDQGTTFPLSIQSFNRLVLFANQVGVYAVFGASVEKVSDKMDGIFQLTSFGQQLSAGTVDINNIRVYALLVSYLDPVLGTRSLILGFMNQKWFTMNQGAGLLAITSFVSSGARVLWGSSGSDVTNLLSSTTAPLAYVLKTSLTPHGNPIVAKRVVRAGHAVTSSGTSDIQMTVDTEGNNSSVIFPIINTPGSLVFVGAQGPITFVGAQGPITFIGTEFDLDHSGQANNTGRYIGSTVTGTLNGISIQALFLEYHDAEIWRTV